MTLNEKIKKRRLELHLTLEQVAEAVGVAKSTVKKWESGQIQSMRQDKIVALAKVLRVSPQYLIFDDETEDTRFEEQIAATEIETELVELSRKMTVAQKVELLNTAYSILKRDK